MTTTHDDGTAGAAHLCLSGMQGVTMYDIDMDTAADQIPVLRKAIPGVMVSAHVSCDPLRP